MPGYINVDAAIQEATNLLKQRDSLQSKIGIVRTDLRNAVELGQASAEQVKYVRETFPKRERKTKSKA
jgi:hypothetical protein